MPVDTFDAFFQLQDLNFLQIGIIQHSLSCEVDISVDFANLLQKINSINIIIQFFGTIHQIGFSICLICDAEPASHFLREQLRADIAEVVDEGFGSCADGFVAAAAEEAEVFDLSFVKSKWHSRQNFTDCVQTDCDVLIIAVFCHIIGNNAFNNRLYSLRRHQIMAGFDDHGKDD